MIEYGKDLLQLLCVMDHPGKTSHDVLARQEEQDVTLRAVKLLQGYINVIKVLEHKRCAFCDREILAGEEQLYDGHHLYEMKGLAVFINGRFLLVVPPKAGRHEMVSSLPCLTLTDVRQRQVGFFIARVALQFSRGACACKSCHCIVSYYVNWDKLEDFQCKQSDLFHALFILHQLLALTLLIACAYYIMLYCL